MMMDAKLTAHNHIAHIERKINFITYRLAPIRLRSSLKLVTNLYKVFVKPLYLLAYSLTDMDKKN
jgi:hypothetical protein